MQDKLKEYVEDHRDKLELYQPREYLWEGINERLPRRRKVALWQRLAIAASVLLAVSCSTWIFMASRQNRVSETSVQTRPPLMDAEVYFTTMVQMKDAELKQYCTPQPELCREFEQDIETLNEAYHQLKKEYTASADKQAILQTMARNLQMQMQLISRQLQIMEAVQHKKEAFPTI